MWGSRTERRAEDSRSRRRTIVRYADLSLDWSDYFPLRVYLLHDLLGLFFLIENAIEAISSQMVVILPRR